jgi:hypothetical protein
MTHTGARLTRRAISSFEASHDADCVSAA